jgi:flotillin
VLDIIVKMLPDLAGRIAEPIASIDKLTVVDTGKGEGAARVSNYVTELMATAPEMLKSVSGIDVEQLIKGLTTGKKGLHSVPSSGEANTQHLPASVEAALTDKE